MKYLTRAQWGAEFDVTTVPVIYTPVKLLFVHHPVGTTTDDPADDMLTIERIDINRFGKPSYDWGVHPSGVVLEGMTTHLSPDTYGHNRDSLSIMFMGNFEVDIPTDAAMFAGRELVQAIKGYGLATSDVVMMGHRDVYPTACPGANLYPRIQELLVPPPPPSSEEVMQFHYARLEEGPAVYLVNMATTPRPILLFDDVDYWATLEGHKINEQGTDVMGADAAGKTRKGIIIATTNVRARQLFGFTK